MKINDYFANQPKSRIYVYACPVDKSTKSYEITADELNCTSPSKDGCEGWDTNIYFPNGGSMSMECSSGRTTKLACTGFENDSETEWELQLTGERTKEKYFSEGHLLNRQL